MPSHSPYQATLDQLERDRAKAQSAVDAYTVAIESLRAVTRGEPRPLVLDFTKSPESPESPRPTGTPKHFRPDMKMWEVAAEAIRVNGAPVRMRDIYEIATTNGWKYSGNFDAFRGSMAPTLKRDSRLVRVGDKGSGLYTLAKQSNEGGQ